MKSNYQQNITLIDNLPEIDDLEPSKNFHHGQSTNEHNKNQHPGLDMIPKNDAVKYQKFLRGGHIAPNQAGMNTKSMYEYQEPHFYQHQPQYQPQPQYYVPSCLETHDHILNCPICAKLYNNDKTIYIIVIIILSIICIMLVKRVLDI